jgi:hypothetical protein
MSFGRFPLGRPGAGDGTVTFKIKNALQTNNLLLTRIFDKDTLFNRYIFESSSNNYILERYYAA